MKSRYYPFWNTICDFWKKADISSALLTGNMEDKKEKDSKSKKEKKSKKKEAQSEESSGKLDDSIQSDKDIEKRLDKIIETLLSEKT